MSHPLLVALILASVMLNATAQILLRVGARAALATPNSSLLETAMEAAFRPPILAGLACYGFSVAVWLFVLGNTEVSFAYPFLALGFVIVALAGWQLLGEPMPPVRVAGIGIILVGVMVLARS